MPARLIIKEVGPWPMNTYLVVCDETQASAIVDPGADADTILSLAQGTQVQAILITHGHPDHVGVLTEVKAATGDIHAIVQRRDAVAAPEQQVVRIAGIAVTAVGITHVISLAATEARHIVKAISAIGSSAGGAQRGVTRSVVIAQRHMDAAEGCASIGDLPMNAVAGCVCSRSAHQQR